MVEGLIQRLIALVEWSRGTLQTFAKGLQEEKEAKSKEKIGFLRLTDSFYLTNCMCTLVALGQAYWESKHMCAHHLTPHGTYLLIRKTDIHKPYRSKLKLQ